MLQNNLELKQVFDDRTIHTGSFDGNSLSIGVVVSTYNTDISKGLLWGAKKALHDCHVPQENITVVTVPGAFELPVMAQKMAKQNKYDAIVCLGAVIKGDTIHFDIVATQAAEGIMRVSLDHGIPVMFGVLTTNTLDQAIKRSRDDDFNKGYEAALTAVQVSTVTL